MKLKLFYTSGIKTEIVDIGNAVPSEYIITRFGSAFELTKLGGNYAIVEEAPLKTLEEVETAPATIEAIIEEVAPAKKKK